MFENTENEVLKFAKGYRSLHKESRSIIDFLLTQEKHKFNGSQTELMEKCGYEVKKYVREGKNLSTNLGQFRKLGIIELSENNVISYNKMDTKGYCFKLTDEWMTILIEKGEY